MLPKIKVSKRLGTVPPRHDRPQRRHFADWPTRCSEYRRRRIVQSAALHGETAQPS
jgi:hypothetical protein